MDRKPSRTRRTWLASCASTAAGVSILAGCTSDSSKPAENDSENNDTLSADTWPMYGVDPQNTGYHPTATGPTGEDVTTELFFEADETISQSPAIIDNTLYTAADGQLYAIDLETGENEWQTELPEVYGAFPAVTKDRVYVAMSDGMATVNRSDGELIWQSSVGISNISPVVSNDTIVGAENMILYRFQSKNGDNTTLFDLRNHNGGRPYTSIPAYNNGSMYFAGNHVLYSVDSTTGDVEWAFENPEEESMGECNPVVADGIVYIGGEDRALYAISAENGREMWSVKTKGEVPRSISIGDGTLYTIASGTVLSGGGIWLIAIDIETESILWVNNMNSYVNRGPVISADRVYHVNSRQLSSYHKQNGKLDWQIGKFEKPISGPPAISENKIFVSTESNNIYSVY